MVRYMNVKVGSCGCYHYEPNDNLLDSIGSKVENRFADFDWYDVDFVTAFDFWHESKSGFRLEGRRYH